ncbi:hypothetical protein TcBrA4_0064750 [Trypanosoma cruzi]|nr:hypothetical protein TcBrA4_0064750 [Trypanosoma cruzi]
MELRCFLVHCSNPSFGTSYVTYRHRRLVVRSGTTAPSNIWVDTLPNFIGVLGTIRAIPADDVFVGGKRLAEESP